MAATPAGAGCGVSEVLKGDKPQPDDLIRVSYEGRYGVLPSGQEYLSNPGVPNQLFYDGATVEVLERADDPAKDLVGTVRESCGRPYAKKATDHWLLIGEDRDVGDRCYDHQIASARVIGACPGTPAAEAVIPTVTAAEIDAWAEADEHEQCRATEGATGIECGLPRRHALDVDHEGTHDPATSKHDGIGYRLTVRWPWCEWDRDAKAVGFEMPLPDWEMLAEESARQQKPEPRVFRSDGPEPPEDVQVLEWLDFDEDFNACRYIKRILGTSVWHEAETPGEGFIAGQHLHWSQVRPSSYREVLS